MKRLLILSFCSTIAFCINAQDYYFNQFHLSPLNISPALAGNNCGGQFLSNFRNQSFGTGVNVVSFRTFSASYDKPKLLANGDKIGFGGRLGYSDAGISNLRSTLLGFAFSYQKRISSDDAKGQYIVGGVDGGIGQVGLDFGSTSGTIRENDFLADFSLGLGYKRELDFRNNLLIGGAVSHLLQPEVVFETAGSIGDIERRYNFYAIGGFPISTLLDIRPRAIYTTSDSGVDLFIGTVGFRYAGLIHQFELSGGAQYLKDPFLNINQSSLILGLTYFYNNFGIMLSREFNVSDLNVAGNNIVEASVIYRPCNNNWVDDMFPNE